MLSILTSILMLLVFTGLQFTQTTCSITEHIKIESRLCTVVTTRYYDYDTLYLLADITDITYQLPIGYYVKIPINITTKYGDIHILLTENNDLIDNNRCYEIALGGWGNSKSEIRRKDYVHEVMNLLQSTFAPYTVPTRMNTKTEINIELSVSRNGTVKVLDLDTRSEFSLNDDSGNAIPIKYIGFSGYQGNENIFTFNCSRKSKISGAVSRGFSSVLYGGIFTVLLVFLITFYLV